jgi:NAD(P)-dependent dehydrogenase (short-subunit alcohol dehydrogenase family)
LSAQLRGRPRADSFQTYYSVSKAAINSFVQASERGGAFGISVCAVMPGDIRTGFTDARVKTHEGDVEYGGRVSRSVAVMERDERGGTAPEVAGAYIARLALQKHVKPLYAIGGKYSCSQFWLSCFRGALRLHRGKDYTAEQPG